MELKDIRTVLLDGDGVLYFTDQPAPGVERFFNTLAERKIDWAIITNNAGKTRSAIVEKLAGFNIAAQEPQIFSSATVTAKRLPKLFGAGSSFYVIGEEALINMLRDAGLQVFTGEDEPEADVDAVVVGIDRQFNYAKAKVANHLIRERSAEFIATNTDIGLPTPRGIAPGTGMIVVGLIATTNLDPVVMGKPETAIFEEAMEALKAEPETTAVIGDRLETDILGGIKAGIGTILMMGGATVISDVVKSEYKPAYIFNDLNQLCDALDKADRNFR